MSGNGVLQNHFKTVSRIAHEYNVVNCINLDNFTTLSLLWVKMYDNLSRVYHDFETRFS